ncbi:MAG: methyltransferase [Prevotella sp.]|nr:methyltransferase [Prevotella sp.]
MSSSKFDFQQFSVSQERCAMKVGTDGVLLGAWAEGGKRILDVGTGTGLIVLMMAQRFPDASVVGIDIDPVACLQARENVLASPFGGRVGVACTSLQDYRDQEVFDCIVSNPPFFENSLKNPDGRRATARHTDTLSFADLFGGVSRLLSEDGVFSAVIPSEVLERFCSNAYLSGLYISRQYDVKTTPRKPVKRCLVAFRKRRPSDFERCEVCLQNTDGSRSAWYSALTRGFYL